ncbi:MAG: hypothetical protein RL660_765 [Bacteroidota bacterium]|jgi:4-diphosphocytidyl-2-C-methyl-D-erythritol kinase
MISFPNCKINLGLNIVSKRSDGYHNLETVFYPIKQLHDALEIIHADTFGLTQTGIVACEDPEKNLVVKAYRHLQQEHVLAPIHIHLHKAIPHGAGLGGGSADATFMLQLLNQFFALQLSQEKLLALALQLGSDCPFFVHNTACYAEGRGEQMLLLDVDLSGKYIVMLKPPVHISTAQAFAGITPQAPKQNCKEVVGTKAITEWKHHLYNDFEQTTFKISPDFASAKQMLYDAGAVYASLSGTGSVVYGIFEYPIELPQVPKEWWSWAGIL